MKCYSKIWLWTIALLAMFACSNKHDGIDNSEARKQFLKNEINRVQRNDSLGYYIGHYLQEGDFYAETIVIMLVIPRRWKHITSHSAMP